MQTLSLLFLIALAQPPAPERATTANPASGPAKPIADLKIAFWYDRNRPLDTFRYQVYDLAKGEDSPELDRWMKTIRDRFPSYSAYTREFDLSRVHGDTRNHKIGTAIQSEFLAVGTAHGYDFGGYVPGVDRLPSASPRPFRPFPVRPLPTPRGRTPELPGPPSSRFPVPIPYPRPHP
jgi:hypothetical protein